MAETTPLLNNTDNPPPPSSSNPESDPSIRYFTYSSEKPIDQELFCSLCHDVYSDPVRSVSCGHSFCKLCIDKWAAIKPTCPLDETPLGGLQFDRLAFNLTENLQTRCSSCQWEGAKSQLRFHLKEAHNVELPRISQGNYGYQTIPTQQQQQQQLQQQQQQQHNVYLMPQQPQYNYPIPQVMTIHQTAPIPCFYHGNALSTNRCPSCRKPICLNCTRFFISWGVSSILCSRCYASRRLFAFVYFFFFFIVLSIISIVVYFLTSFNNGSN
jgi:hypothetical protein